MAKLVIEEGQPKKRSGADDVNATINGKWLNGSSRPGAVLYLIEKNDRIPRHNPEIKERTAEFAENVISLDAAGEYLPMLGSVNEVDVKVTGVVVSGKAVNDEGLANLPSPLNKESLLSVRFLPMKQRIVEFSLKHSRAFS